MKKSRICFKCGSNKVVKAIDKSRYNNALNINAFKVAVSTKYVCCDCGYFEEYFDNEKDREVIFDEFKEN